MLETAMFCIGQSVSSQLLIHKPIGVKMDVLEDNLTVDEKLILFNTIKRALDMGMNKNTTYQYDLKMIKSPKFQALEKVLFLLAEELLKDSEKPEYNKWSLDNWVTSMKKPDLISEAQTIKSVISGYVEN